MKGLIHSMPLFKVTGFPSSYAPPEDESIILPTGAGRRVKGVPFGVTEATAQVLRTLPYVEEITDADTASEANPDADVGDPPTTSDTPPVTRKPPTGRAKAKKAKE